MSRALPISITLTFPFPPYSAIIKVLKKHDKRLILRTSRSTPLAVGNHAPTAPLKAKILPIVLQQVGSSLR